MSPRVRGMTVASLLVVFFAVGMVWLVSRATSTPGFRPVADSSSPTELTSPPESPSQEGTATAKSTGTGGTRLGTDPETPAPTTAPPDPGDPPKPARSVNVAGPRLDGDEENNGCGRVLLHPDDGRVEVPVHIDGITLTTQPESARAIHDDKAGCGKPADLTAPFCADVMLGPGGADSCLVGFRLEPEPAPEPEYSVTVGLNLRVRCTSATPYPCSEIKDPVPSPAEPADGIWSRAGPSLVVAGEPDPPAEEPPADDPGTSSSTAEGSP